WTVWVGWFVWFCRAARRGNTATTPTEKSPLNAMSWGTSPATKLDYVRAKRACKYFNPESGLHYNRHRYYNPNLGRYVTPDSLKLAGRVNAYQYVPNPTE
ncbi:RHS repeat-associated core domain-containing protein, partial [Pseudomonas tolaasii]|uniref:RHS repeat-associated core domain-containing protein n=1 Tax=Pseudomonas tolaasii TaxID=29442 RepID=UPI001C5774A4